MLMKYCDEALAVGWLKKMHHLVYNDFFHEVLRLLHEFGIEADVSCPVIATARHCPVQVAGSKLSPASQTLTTVYSRGSDVTAPWKAVWIISMLTLTVC
jgi:hypothetical protein